MGKAIILKYQSVSPQGKEKDLKWILLVAHLARDLESGIGRMVCQGFIPTVTFGMRRAYRFAFCPCPIQPFFFLFLLDREGSGRSRGKGWLFFILSCLFLCSHSTSRKTIHACNARKIETNVIVVRMF